MLVTPFARVMAFSCLNAIEAFDLRDANVQWFQQLLRRTCRLWQKEREKEKFLVVKRSFAFPSTTLFSFFELVPPLVFRYCCF